MSMRKNKVPEDIQAHNMKLYHAKKRPSSGYYCTKCKGRVSLGSSYSNKGYALQCTCCVINGQHEEKLTLTQYLAQKIWNVEIPVEYWDYLSDYEVLLEPLEGNKIMSPKEKALKLLKDFQEERLIPDVAFLCTVGHTSFTVEGVRIQIESETRMGCYFIDNIENILKGGQHVWRE